MKLNFVLMYVARFFFFFSCLTGWKIEGDFPNVAKFVTIIAPHTSLMDLWNMLSARVLLNVDCYTFYEVRVR